MFVILAALLLIRPKMTQITAANVIQRLTVMLMI